MEENMSNLTYASGEASVSSNYSHPQQFFAPPLEIQPVKKKRNLPGNPDPEAEVIALSPKTLMATNRFICEICNKGFQRDQNLQLHRRGHNLPWKLKQRASKEMIRKKVYVCPEVNCVHHDPSRALGDLTGIKKHFCRKHGEKKWKCDKCSKRYAVQSDWKAHSKSCGTKEYRCDCGTLFSRRDSFITHRAFCDALAQETSKTNPNNIPISLKKEPEIPQWLGFDYFSSLPVLSNQDFIKTHDLENPNSNPNPNPNFGPSLFPPYQQTPSTPHISATALLQKAAQMGATMTKNGSSMLSGTHLQSHVTSDLASHDQMVVSSSPFGNKAAIIPSGLHAMMTSLTSSPSAAGGGASHGGAGGEGLTRDFLGLRGISHSAIMSIAALGNCINNSQENQNQNQEPWQG